MTITTGSNAIQNAGLIESTGAGGLTIEGAIDDSGFIDVSAGYLDIQGVATATGIPTGLNRSGPAAPLSADRANSSLAGPATWRSRFWRARHRRYSQIRSRRRPATQAAGATEPTPVTSSASPMPARKSISPTSADNYIKVNVTVNTNELGSWGRREPVKLNGASETLSTSSENHPRQHLYFIPLSDGHGGTMLTYNAKSKFRQVEFHPLPPPALLAQARPVVEPLP